MFPVIHLFGWECLAAWQTQRGCPRTPCLQWSLSSWCLHPPPLPLPQLLLLPRSPGSSSLAALPASFASSSSFSFCFLTFWPSRGERQRESLKWQWNPNTPHLDNNKMTYWFGCWGCAHCGNRKCQTIVFVNEICGASITAPLWLIFCSGSRADSHRAALAHCTAGLTHSSEQAGNFYNKSDGDSRRHVAHCSSFIRNLHAFKLASHIWILYALPPELYWKQERCVRPFGQ